MPVIVTSTIDDVGKSRVTADGCIVLGESQGLGRAQAIVDAQTYEDARAVITANGFARSLCLTALLYGFLALALGIWTLVTILLVGRGRAFTLYSSDVDELGVGTATPRHSWPLDYILVGFQFALAITMLVVAIAGREDYFATRIYFNGELVTGQVAYWMHKFFIGAAVLLLLGYSNVWTFYLLSLGIALVVAFSYAFVANATGQDEPGSFESILGFSVATVANIVQWIGITYTLIVDDHAGWVIGVTLVFLLLDLAYWIHVLMWMIPVGMYAGVTIPRANFHRYAIISLVLLGLMNLFVQVLYNLFELELV